MCLECAILIYHQQEAHGSVPETEDDMDQGGAAETVQSGGEVGGSAGNSQDVERSESQSLPSSIKNRRVQMIRDTCQVTPDSGIVQSPDTIPTGDAVPTDQDDQMSIDGIEVSNSMLTLQQEGFSLIDVYLGESAIEALQDAEEFIANDLSPQFLGELDPLNADLQASSENLFPNQGTELDAIETSPESAVANANPVPDIDAGSIETSPESSGAVADANPVPDISASSIVTLNKGKQISRRSKRFPSSVGKWKSRLRSSTLVNKTGNNIKETEVPPKRKTRLASSTSSSSSCSAQEFRVRDRNEEKQVAEKLPIINATHSNLAAPHRVSTSTTIHDTMKRDVREISCKDVRGG